MERVVVDRFGGPAVLTVVEDEEYSEPASQITIEDAQEKVAAGAEGA